MPAEGQTVTKPFKLDDPKRQRRFFDALRAEGDVALACRQARVSEAAAYRWRLARPEMAEAWNDAVDTAFDSRVRHVEESLYRMATRQTDVVEYNLRHEPVKDERGMPTGGGRLKKIPTAIKSTPPSATAAIFLLKGWKPEVYGDRDRVAEERIHKIEVYEALVRDFIQEAERRARLAGKVDYALSREKAIATLAKLKPDIYEVLGSRGPGRALGEGSDE